MTKRLNDGDRRAVDLLLDRAVSKGNGNGSSAAAGNGSAGFATHVQPVDEQRVSAVSRLLKLLDEMTAPEPSDDLAARTLRRIGAATGEPLPGMQVPAPGAFGAARQQPHA
jgi:hypothetical protein